MSNQHITEFLNYYIGLSEPQYAVLLKGKWGSGKTYFINEYKKELAEKKQKYIYVSLYGVTSYDEIETKFLQSTNPTIFNNKTIFAGKLADAFIDNKIKNSLNTIKKSLTDLNAKGNILIFDDLERCSIKIIDLLGYINSFVEHQSYKVILIANEEELEKTEKYSNIKEKLIGKTFELTSNSVDAYNFFLNELKNEKNAKELIFKKYEELILNIFNQSEYNNLRVLRQSILDFERIFNSSLYEYDNKDLIEDFIRIYFIFHSEIKSNDYTIDKYLKDHDNNNTNQLKKEFKVYDEAEELTVSLKYGLFKEKYKFTYDKHNLILSPESWNNILINSEINVDELKMEIDASSYFINENTPNWKKLAFYHKLNDSEFEELLEEVYNDFLTKYCEDFGQYMLITSLLLFFKEEQLFNVNDKDLNEKLLEGLELVYEKNKEELKKIVFKERDYENGNERSYKNIGYCESENFNKLKKYIDDFFEKKQIEILQKNSNLLIDSVNENDGNKLFNIMAGYNDVRKFDFSNKPILVYTDIDLFYKALINTDGNTMRYFGDIIAKRYYKTKENIFIEKEFLLKLLVKIEKYIDCNEYKLSTYNLRTEIKTNLELAISNIEYFENEEKNK